MSDHKDETVDVAQTWDRAFAESDTFHWTQPHELVSAWVDAHPCACGASALDIGCGYGRHAILLAQHGYAVTATDVVQPVLSRLTGMAQDAGLNISTRLHDMNQHPYPFDNGTFNVVIAAHSIHHTDVQGLRDTIADIERILKPGGALLMVAPPRPLDMGSAHEFIEPETAVPLDGPEKGVPHHYLSAASARSLLAHFSITVELDSSGHLFIIAKRPGR